MFNIILFINVFKLQFSPFVTASPCHLPRQREVDELPHCGETSSIQRKVCELSSYSGLIESEKSTFLILKR